jgi:hypothetical protein
VLGGWVAAVIVAAGVLQASARQEPYVRQAVDAVMAMLNAEGDAAIADFVQTAMVPSPDR